MAFLEDSLKIDIDDVDDVVRVWVRNDKNNKKLKHIKELEAIYENSIHGSSTRVINNDLAEGDNYIVIGAFNKVFNGKTKLKFFSFPLIFKGGKISYAISISLNNTKIWSCFNFTSDNDMINQNPKCKKSIFLLRIFSNYFGCRTKEEEETILGLKYYHVFKVIKKDNKLYFSELYYEDLTEVKDLSKRKSFHLETFETTIKNEIWKELEIINNEFKKNERYADGECLKQKNKGKQ